MKSIRLTFFFILFVSTHSFSQSFEIFYGENGKYGLKDTTGNIIIPAEYDEIAGDFYTNSPEDKLFSEGMARVRLDNKWGFVDSLGNRVIPPKFTYVKIFSEGLAGVYLEEKGKWGFIDKTGALVIPAQFETIGNFSQGLATAWWSNEKHELQGYIDKKGNKVISEKYYTAYPFTEEGLAKVEAENGWGFIDKKGKVIVPLIYDRVKSYKNGKAEVSLKDETFFIDTKGKRIN